MKRNYKNFMRSFYGIILSAALLISNVSNSSLVVLADEIRTNSENQAGSITETVSQSGNDAVSQNEKSPENVSQNESAPGTETVSGNETEAASGNEATKGEETASGNELPVVSENDVNIVSENVSDTEEQTGYLDLSDKLIHNGAILSESDFEHPGEEPASGTADYDGAEAAIVSAANNWSGNGNVSVALGSYNIPVGEADFVLKVINRHPEFFI